MTCSSWNYNGLIYEPDPEKKYCPTMDPASCTQFSCCIETRCKPVEHCVGLLGCMAPEQESSCSACAEGWFGGNCVACPAIEHALPGTTYACTAGVCRQMRHGAPTPHIGHPRRVALRAHGSGELCTWVGGLTHASQQVHSSSAEVGGC